MKYLVKVHFEEVVEVPIEAESEFDAIWRLQEDIRQGKIDPYKFAGKPTYWMTTAEKQ